MSIRNKAISSVLWTSINTLGTQGVSFVVSLFLARLLSPAEFGLIAMMTLFIGIGNVLVNGGMATSLIRTTDVDDEDFTAVFYFNLITSICVYLLVFIFSHSVALFYDQPVLEKLIKVYSLTFIIDAFSRVQATILSKNLEFKTEMRINIPALLASGLVGISMAFLGFGVWSLVFSAITNSFFVSMQLWLRSTWRPILNINIKKLKRHWEFGYKLLVSELIATFFNNLYSIIIGKYFLPTQVGFFQRADTLKQLPVGIIGSILNKVTLPLFSTMQNDDKQLKEYYSRLMKIVVYIVSPTLFFMAALAIPLIRLLFTKTWLPTVPYFQVLCLNGILYPIHAYNLNILYVKGRSDLFLKLEVIKKTIAIVVILISLNFGIYGLLWGSVVVSFVSFFVNTYYSGQFINYALLDQIKDVLPYILFGLLIAIFVHQIDIRINHQYSDFVRIFLGGIMATLVFFGISHFFKFSAYNDLKKLLLKVN
jgi:teichuronic acid exporter